MVGKEGVLPSKHQTAGNASLPFCFLWNKKGQPLKSHASSLWAVALSQEGGESKVLVFRTALEYHLRDRRAVEEGAKGSALEQSGGRSLLSPTGGSCLSQTHWAGPAVSLPFPHINSSTFHSYSCCGNCTWGWGNWVIGELRDFLERLKGFVVGQGTPSRYHRPQYTHGDVKWLLLEIYTEQKQRWICANYLNCLMLTALSLWMCGHLHRSYYVNL